MSETQMSADRDLVRFKRTWAALMLILMLPFFLWRLEHFESLHLPRPYYFLNLWSLDFLIDRQIFIGLLGAFSAALLAWIRFPRNTYIPIVLWILFATLAYISLAFEVHSINEKVRSYMSLPLYVFGFLALVPSIPVEQRNRFARIGILAVIGFTYFAPGVFKLLDNASAWLNGDAVYFVAWNGYMAADKPLAQWLVQYPDLCRWTGRAVVQVELLAIPLILWRSRTALLMAIGFHLLTFALTPVSKFGFTVLPCLVAALWIRPTTFGRFRLPHFVGSPPSRNKSSRFVSSR